MQAHEQGQLLRLDGSLMESRKTLKACSVEACPAVVQRDCVRWLDEVSSQIPTVVFEAITESGAAQKVTVRQGDQLLTQELDGRPLEMDPGYYEFRFEVAGRASKTISVLLKQGEKNRLVSVDFRAPLDTPPPVAPPPASAQPPTPPTTTARPVPTSVYIMGSMAGAGIASATFFGISTRTKESNAYDECAPRCSERRVNEIKRWALATDLSLGLASFATVTALVLYAYRPSVTTAEESVSPSANHMPLPVVGVGPGHAWAGLGGSF